MLAKFQSLYNFVQVLEVSRRADYSLASCCLLLLDWPRNIQSVYNPYKVTTSSYYDVFGTILPLLLNGPVGILGLGARSATHIWRDNDLNNIGRSVVHVGDALASESPREEGFVGLIVDMFLDGAVIPTLQQPQTWQQLRQHLKPRELRPRRCNKWMDEFICGRHIGRIMVNYGGSCMEANIKSQAKDDESTMKETLKAMLQVFSNEVLQFRVPAKGNNSITLSSPCPNLQACEKALLPVLQGLCDWVLVS